MEVLRGIESLPAAGNGDSVVTVGFFDGVHLGHRAVFARTVEQARASGLASVAVTFDRHPREILTPGSEPRLLTTTERKADLIAETGIDTLVVLTFDRDFSTWPPEEFAKRVLVEGLRAKHVVVGANFTFGYKARGTVDTLMELGSTRGFLAEGVSLVDLDGKRVSSTSVREALADGDLEWPRRALGRRFVLDGSVVTGHGRGKGLGYPTANLETWPRLLLPGRGIYAAVAQHHGVRYTAAVDVGTNPTFGVEPLHVEAFLLDYDGGELPGEPLSVEFWARLRDEVRFDSPEELVAQIAADVEQTRSIIGSAIDSGDSGPNEASPS
jgi:riboflavin kinase/FMN adenylyltransferase